MSSEPKIHTKPYKNCPECKSNKIVKNGHKNSIQRFKCKSCGFRFQSRKQTSRKSSSLLNSYLLKNNLYQTCQKQNIGVISGSEIKLIA